MKYISLHIIYNYVFSIFLQILFIAIYFDKCVNINNMYLSRKLYNRNELRDKKIFFIKNIKSKMCNI